MDPSLCGLGAVQESVDRLKGRCLDEVSDCLTPIESAKLKISLAYGLASLQFILLQLKGEDTSVHPIREEISRVKEYVQTIQELEEQAKSKQRPHIDEEAASRMIQFELSKNIAAIADDQPPRKKSKAPKSLR